MNIEIETIERKNVNQINVVTTAKDGVTTDGLLKQTQIEIRVYN